MHSPSSLCLAPVKMLQRLPKHHDLLAYLFHTLAALFAALSPASTGPRCFPRMPILRSRYFLRHWMLPRFQQAFTTYRYSHSVWSAAASMLHFHYRVELAILFHHILIHDLHLVLRHVTADSYVSPTGAAGCRDLSRIHHRLSLS